MVLTGLTKAEGECGSNAVHWSTETSPLHAHTALACWQIALWHVESSRTRDGTHVPCIGRRILNRQPPGKSESPYF